MEKLQAGKMTRVQRRLEMKIPDAVFVKNETHLDIVLDEEENCDGSKPSLTVKIRQVLRRDDVLERGVL